MANGHRCSSRPSSMGGLRIEMPSQSKLITKLELDDWHAIATRAPLAHRRFYRRDRKRPSEKAQREFGRDFPDDQ